MENKGKITISLGTAICIFIIVLLIIALVGVICYNSNKGKNEITNNKLEDNIIDKNIEKNNLKNNTEITSSKEKKTIQKVGKVSAQRLKRQKKMHCLIHFCLSVHQIVLFQKINFQMIKRVLLLNCGELLNLIKK